MFRHAFIFFSCISLTASMAQADEKPYSPYVGQDFPRNVYFGDTHLHTNISFDAYGDGNIKLGRDEAYRFAKGAQLEGHDGQPVRMSRPLDFLVIADHAEYMGIVQGIADANPLLIATEAGARWAEIAGEEDGLIQVFGEMTHDGATNQPRDLGTGSPKQYGRTSETRRSATTIPGASPRSSVTSIRRCRRATICTAW
jgi:hypothetical protein